MRVEHTDVVVIGNGPSGICMSYVLAGHWPYYTGQSHSNELLTLRLQHAGTEKSLLLQDLAYLSDGLEGRTSNPVALLVDALCNPDADIGANQPSLLRWEFHPENAIPHVVLGLHDEGGVWQTIEDNIQSLSLGQWMELPDMPFHQWRSEFNRKKGISNGTKGELRSNRATAFEVRNYYKDYVEAKGLRSFFRNQHLVTSVTQVSNSLVKADCESGEEEPEDVAGCGKKLLWEVRGVRQFADPETGASTTEEFCYRTPSVVMANGAFDLPNMLGVPGEERPYILRSVAELDDRIQRGKITKNGDPVVVVGAGLSAADAIHRARSANVPVVHVFRHGGHDPLAVFRQLPPALYPEYDAVHKLMRSPGSSSATGSYCSYPSARIVEFKADNEVVLKIDDTEDHVVVRASCVLVLIGSRPNLTFLGECERKIGIVHGVAIDGKKNPVDVDAYSYQSNRCPGLYAVGPLVGDNFVRFLRGGAVGVVAHLWSNRSEKPT